MKNSPYLVYFVVAAFILLLFQCRPERAYVEEQDARLEFTVDTVYFDTVLTTFGTVTRSFRVKNPYNRFVKISEIRLAGGSSSLFRINIDGLNGPVQENLELAPHDSMYVFVEATPAENGVPGFLRIQDSIVFVTNGNTQDVDLVAWGQDVHILRDSVLDYNAVWTADKPYLIIDGILVDTLNTLRMEPGVQVYLHRNASIYVLGTLEIAGTTEAPVEFRGDRFEAMYDNLPGQWGVIYFITGSRANRIDNARILNGTVGLWADSLVSTTEPVLTISNTFINQMSYDGLLARGTSVKAWNLAIGDCGNACAELLYSGSYEFDHCTFGNYWRSGFALRQFPALYIANYYGYYDTISEDVVVIRYEVRDIEKAEFRNSIIYGENLNELVVDRHPDGQLNYLFDHCLTRIDRSKFDYTLDPDFKFIINSYDPKFDSVHVSLELDSLSPAIDQGLLDYAITHPFDLNGNSRVSDGKPDLGAFERNDL
ncbi:MAG: choice-of-anchor Q domain-containing protein [Bacteroidota bacterium]